MWLINVITDLFGAVSEAKESLLNALDGLEQWLISLVYSYVSAYVDLLGKLIDVVFSYDGAVGPFQRLQNVFIAVACVAMIVICLFKVIQNLFDIGGGDGEYVPIPALITRVVKSNVMIVLIPLVMKIGISGIAMIAKLMAYDMGTSLATVLENFVEHIAVVLLIPNPSNMYVTAVNGVFILTAIGVTVFFFKTCKYQVDLLILDVFIVWAAVSQCTDDKTFYNVFVKTFMNIMLSMCVNLLIFAGLIWSFSNAYGGVSIGPLMVFIGCIFSIFCPPELVKNYGKAESGVKRAAGGVASVAARLVLKM